jgi:sugar phosphate isomerase/epimerase
MLAALGVGTALLTRCAGAAAEGVKLKHSVCRAPFAKIPIDEFCEACKALGIESIELLEPHEYPDVMKHGLQCAVGRFTSKRLPESHIICGWNNPEFHEVLIPGYTELIQKTADVGFKKVICFSGSRRGMDEKTGLENCAIGISKLMPLCDRVGVTMVMELLNSKVNHPDYMADNTPFGVSLCEKIGSPNFRLLYDIYHMQIMEGNLIATIRQHHQWLAHYHTAGVPGRSEIDDTQEIHYPAVIKAILDTGYRDYLGQEFSPKRPDKIASLRQAIEICTPTYS